MKFLESTNFFVRTVVYDFVNRNEEIKLIYRLFPMVHIGSTEYYLEVLENLKNCDEIFYEGISLLKRESSFLERISLKNLGFTFKQYKMVADKLGLVTQNEYLRLEEVKSKLTHTDFNEETGSEAWQELSMKERLKLTFVNPFQFFIYHQGITREILVKDFMTSREEAYLAYGPLDDEKGTSRNFIMNEREQIIFKSIRKRMKSESKEEKIIGIIYGSGHMKSIARYLIDHYNYVPRSGKFIKVFDVEYNKKPVPNKL